MGKRRKSRELALQWLYEIDVAKRPTEEVIGQANDWVPDNPEVQEFAASLARGVRQHLEELDAILSKFACGWTIDRMAIVDRNILRLALFEILWRPEIPHRVSINEAVDLAKNYSTAESGRFVNGILGNLVRARGNDNLNTGEMENAGKDT